MTKSELISKIEHLKNTKKCPFNTKEFKNLKSIIEHYTENFNQYNPIMLERVFVLLNDITDRPKCPTCGNSVNFYKNRYLQYCSNKCVNYSKIISAIRQNKKKNIKSLNLSKKELILRIKEIINNNPDSFYNTNEYLLLYTEIKNHTKFLDKFSDTSINERCYALLNKISDRPKCIDCGKYVKYLKHGKYNTFCGESCGTKSKITKEKVKKTCQEKYGTDHHLQAREVIDKREQTNLKKYGFEHPLQSPIIQEKYKKTCFERYGVENVFQSPIIQEKIKQTCFERYGFEYPSQSPIIQEKYKKTCLEKFGVEHPLQSPEIHAKQVASNHRSKKYIFSSGRIEYVQGYEPQALDELVNHFSEDDIVCGKGLPSIKYEFENKNRVYHPDIYIKSKNLIIEVKSIYTYQADFEKNQAKMKATKKAGYNFWFSIGC